MTAPDWLMARPVAHRGLHDRASGLIENSTSAAEAAIAGGFAIECDVQASADGEAMVFHDDRLDRLTAERGALNLRRADDLGTIRLAGSADTISTLPAFLDRIGGRVPLVIEIKSRFDGATALAARVAEICEGREAPIALKSFDPEVLAVLRDLAPHRPRGIVAANSYEAAEYDALSEAQKHAMANLLHLDRTAPDFLSWRVRDLPDAAPFLARRLGLPVMTWTVRSQEDRDRAAAWADQIVFEGFRPD